MELQERMAYIETVKMRLVHSRLIGWTKMHELNNEHTFGGRCFQAG